MFKNFEEMQTFGKNGMDATTSSFGALSKGLQAINTEIADYSRKAFEESTTATERFLNAKTAEKAFEVQNAYIKSAYESFVAQSTKLGDLYSQLLQDIYKPFEGATTKASAK